MISFLGHVCLSADLIVSAIHSSALNAGIRIDTRGFMAVQSSSSQQPVKRWGRVQYRMRAGYRLLVLAAASCAVPDPAPTVRSPLEIPARSVGPLAMD